MNRMRVSGENVKVRWDSVVDCRPEAEVDVPFGVGLREAPTGEPAMVKVWLYGTLAREGVARPLALEIAGELTAAAIIDELAARLGDDFRAQVFDVDGKKFNQCLVFVDGVKVAKLDALVPRGAASVDVEMILLTVTEGG